MAPVLPSGSEESAVALVVLAGAVGWIIWRLMREVSRGMRLSTPAVRVAAFAAVCCTAYSADTSWRFAGDYLGMGSVVERTAMFAAAEVALFATALLARQNLNGPRGATGAPGVLVWVITGVQVIPAYAESGVVGGTVRAFIGPVMAAMLWHLAMGIELRHRAPASTSYGLLRRLGREARERFLSRIGVAERDRDAAQITRDRATARAAELASRLAEQTAAQRGGRRGRRTSRRLAVAVARACVGTDAAQRRSLLDQLAARRHAAGLATVELPSPWQLADEQGAGYLAAKEGPAAGAEGSDVADEVNTPPRSPGQESEPEASAEEAQSAKLPTAKAQAVIHDGWARGLSVRETAKLATRAPSYVHRVYVRLDESQSGLSGTREIRGGTAESLVLPGAGRA